MNKEMSKKDIVICVFAICVTTVLVCSGYYIYKNQKPSVKHFEKLYSEEPTTIHLLELYNSYIEETNIKCLDYVDSLLSAKDYEKAAIEYYESTDKNTYGLELANLISPMGKDIIIVNALYVCGANNNIEKYLYCMDKYYYQLSPKAKVRMFHDAMLLIETQFLIDNKDIIAEKLHSLALKNDDQLLKISDLLNVLAFYRVIDAENTKIDTITSEIKEIFYQLEFDGNEHINNWANSRCQKYMDYWNDLLNK